MMRLSLLHGLSLISVIRKQQNFYMNKIPNFYTWNGKDKDFRRSKMPGFAVGRINHVPPKIDDAYHLCILINNIRGPKGFDYLG